jgi:hypothetical protein
VGSIQQDLQQNLVISSSKQHSAVSIHHHQHPAVFYEELSVQQ